MREGIARSSPGPRETGVRNRRARGHRPQRHSDCDPSPILVRYLIVTTRCARPGMTRIRRALPCAIDPFCAMMVKPGQRMATSRRDHATPKWPPLTIIRPARGIKTVPPGPDGPRIHLWRERRLPSATAVWSSTGRRAVGGIAVETQSRSCAHRRRAARCHVLLLDQGREAPWWIRWCRRPSW